MAEEISVCVCVCVCIIFVCVCVCVCEGTYTGVLAMELELYLLATGRLGFIIFLSVQPGTGQGPQIVIPKGS